MKLVDHIGFVCTKQNGSDAGAPELAGIPKGVQKFGVFVSPIVREEVEIRLG